LRVTEFFMEFGRKLEALGLLKKNMDHLRRNEKPRPPSGTR